MNKKVKIWDKENNIFLVLYLSTILIVYYSPSPIIPRIVFLIILFIIYNSKKDYFWLAWIFVIVDSPGHLFSGGAFGDTQRIPIYPISPGEVLSFYDLLAIVYLLKIFSRKTDYSQFIFLSQVRIFVGIIFFYLGLSFLLFGLDFTAFYRSISPWIFVYAIIAFMHSEEKFYRFNKLIFPFVVFAILAQVFSFIQGQHLVNYLKIGGEYQFKEHLAILIDENAERPGRNLYSIFIILYSLTLAVVYYSRKNSVFPKNYLVFLIIAAFFSTILTGTRGFLLSSSVIVFGSILLGIKNMTMTFRYATIVGLIIIVSIEFSSYVPILGRQLELVTQRYQTLYLLAQGDLTMGGTLERLTIRKPRIMKIIKQSPFFGFGFSKTYYLHADNDIGFYTVILNVGYLGSIALHILFIVIMAKIFQVSSMRSYNSVYQNSGYIFLFGFAGIIIFHITTNIAFGLTPSANESMHERYMIYGFLLVQFSATAKTSIETLNKIRVKHSFI